MKTQLIILSALLVSFVSQCSFYDRMKAKAASAAQSVKNTATSAYDKFGGMAQSASNKLSSAASSVKNTVGRESQAFMSGVRSVPGQLSNIKEDIEDKLSLWGYRAIKTVKKLSPELDEVTITNAETGEKVVAYVNPLQD